MTESAMAQQTDLLVLSCLHCLLAVLVLQMWIYTSSRPNTLVGCPPALPIMPKDAVGTELELNTRYLADWKSAWHVTKMLPWHTVGLQPLTIM